MMTPTMKAWISNPDAPGRLHLADLPRPVPNPDQLLVKVSAYSINRGETFLVETPPANWRPGKDIAGEVVEFGAQVKDFHPGQRVVAHLDQAGWAQWAVVNVAQAIALPDTLDDVTAAAIPLAGLTALRLTRAAGPLASRRVLITGASGGVGHAFVQLAAAQGAAVTAVVADPERGHRLLELGATALVGSLEEAEGPFDVILESTGGPALAAAWEKLAHDGRLVWFGQASRTPATLDFFNWKGGMSGTLRKFHYLDDPTPVNTDLQALVRLVAQGRLDIEVGRVDGWRDTPAAIGALLGRQVRGNLVVKVD